MLVRQVLNLNDLVPLPKVTSAEQRRAWILEHWGGIGQNQLPEAELTSSSYPTQVSLTFRVSNYMDACPEKV